MNIISKTMQFLLALLFWHMVFPPLSAAGQTQDIVKKMLPDGNLRNLVIPQDSEKGSVVRQLKTAQKDVQQIAFSLAILNADYASNRDYLLWVLKGCDVPEITRGCDDMTAAYLIYLYERGHSEILVPLFRASINNYNASGAETLGSFFSQLVAKSPNTFLDADSLFPISEQAQICYGAGLADGGGMALSDLKDARKKLSMINSKNAKRCLQQIEQANSTAKR